MLDDFERQNGVEALAGGGQRLRRGVAVVDGEPLLLGMVAGRADVGLRRVDGDHLGAQPTHRLGHQPAAAADVEEPEAGQRLERRAVGARIALGLGHERIPHIGDADRVQRMQGAEGAVTVPPALGKRGEALDLRRIYAGVVAEVAGIARRFSRLRGLRRLWLVLVCGHRRALLWPGCLLARLGRSQYVRASPRSASVASPTQARPTRWL